MQTMWPGVGRGHAEVGEPTGSVIGKLFSGAGAKADRAVEPGKLSGCQPCVTSSLSPNLQVPHC